MLRVGVEAYLADSFSRDCEGLDIRFSSQSPATISYSRTRRDLYTHVDQWETAAHRSVVRASSRP